ncbi:MAG: CHASE3 domain-containing protein [Pseudomonadota bacterium]
MQASIPIYLAPRFGRIARKDWHHLLLALGCVFVLLLLGSSHRQAIDSLDALDGLQLQAERVERLDGLLIQLVAAENAVRGYLLSGNRAHLEPYRLANMGERVEEIRRDFATNPANDDALADLSGLVAIKLRSLDQAVQRGMAGQETRIQGKRYTDRIRDLILGLEAQLLAQGRVSFERSTRDLEQTRAVVVVLAAGAVALMVLLYFVLERQLQLREQLAGLLRSENQRLDSVVQERTAELSELASHLTNVSETEKARLARELHDELGALLTAAKMESGWIARKLDGVDGVDGDALAPCRERLARLERLLDDGIAMKRRIIDDLRPPLLEMLGLVSALRALGEEFARDAEARLSLDLPADDVELDPAPALATFRIAQEALTNIRKHARARRVKLALRVVAGKGLALEIEDDGQGFLAAAASRRHHGLAGMKHRVQMCAGDFILSSRPGAGVRIVARIPLTAR